MKKQSKEKVKKTLNALENFKGVILILGIVVLIALAGLSIAEASNIYQPNVKLWIWGYWSFWALVLILWRTQKVIRTQRKNL